MFLNLAYTYNYVMIKVGTLIPTIAANISPIFAVKSVKSLESWIEIFLQYTESKSGKIKYLKILYNLV